MLRNHQKRIKYLGFDDTWFVATGVVVLAFVVDYLFNQSFARQPLGTAILQWCISLFFATCNWLIMRRVLIFFRKKFPDFRDNAKRILLVFISILGTVILIDRVGNVVLSFSLGPAYHPQPQSQILVPIVLISVMVIAIYEAIYFYSRLQQAIREEEQSKQAVIQAQLDALNNQIQPHFLFNSLNTLRDIIDQNTKEDAKQFVDNLANVYHFILEAKDTQLIALRDELKFARAYSHIQSERFGANLQLNWDIPAASLDSLIVPMSLQFLLENAIKHNVISKAKPLTINIQAEDKHLTVTNKIQAKSTELPSTKVGLKNIEKRYALIANQAVVVKNDGNQFMVSLPLLTMTDKTYHHADTDH